MRQRSLDDLRRVMEEIESNDALPMVEFVGITTTGLGCVLEYTYLEERCEIVIARDELESGQNQLLEAVVAKLVE